MHLDSEDSLQMLRKAKSAHIKWRAYAQGLIAGLDISEDRTPALHTNCAFGKWYYGAGNKALGHLELYEGIDVPHRILHELYSDIYHHVQKGKFDKARERLPQLVEISRTLLESIALLEQEIASK